MMKVYIPFIDILHFIQSSVDATNTAGLGRWVNDIYPSAANCKMVLLYADDAPHLCLFANQDIPVRMNIFLASAVENMQ